MTRRGIAMLLVLVVLVVAVTAAANVARVSMTGIAADRIGRDTRLADDLLGQAESAAFAWLGRESGSVVLPPDSDRPSIGIVHDVISVEGFSSTITITAVDLLGMPSVANTEQSGLRSALPSDVLKLISDSGGDGHDFGTDMIGSQSLERSVYPAQAAVDPVVYTEPNLFKKITDDNVTGANALPSVCETVAFVAATPRQRMGRDQIESDPALLNVNTAPIRLIERALQNAGLDALGPILEAREEGRPARLSGGFDNDAPIRLVTRSTLWGFRCDVRSGSVHRARWVVFEQSGGAWRLTRRIVINE